MVGKRLRSEICWEDGEFLTFSYDGNSRLDVKVYAKSGLLKDIEAETETETESKEEEDDQTEYTFEGSEGSSKHTGSGLSQTGRAKSRSNAATNSSTHVLRNVHFWADITPSSKYELHVSQIVTNIHGIEQRNF